MIVSRLSVEQQAPLTLSAPGITSGAPNPDTKTATLLLSDLGDITLDGATYSLESLISNGNLSKDQPILLTLDETVTFQQTLTVLETLHMAGYTNAKLSTKGETE